MPEALKVAICARTRLYRDGVAASLARVSDIDVIGTAAHADACLDLVLRTRADVALVDAEIDEVWAVVRELGQIEGRPQIVLLSIPNEERHVLACVEAGAAGFVTAEESLDDLIETILSVGRGEARCSPRIAGALMRRIAALASARGRSEAAVLTAREELEVSRLIAAGLSNKAIAAELCIELATAKNHVHSVLAKLEIGHRYQVAARLRELDLAVPTRSGHDGPPRLSAWAPERPVAGQP
jgi:two-component system nitrate/nitrite response regulator NarL